MAMDIPRFWRERIHKYGPASEKLKDAQWSCWSRNLGLVAWK